ncbi:hypothetical protein LTR27_011453 [Elasticomyces elasticus]|nr:hypothetical protein LTR27_011453 [Elasticomyces elasticus]
MEQQQHHVTIMATLPQQDHTAPDESVAGAAAKVFAVPELLEMILLPLHQDTLQLFPLRRVNSTFHDLIRSSKVLRHYVELQHPITNRETRGLIFNPVIPMPPGKTDICSPLDIFSSPWNVIYIKLNKEWYPRLTSSPKQTMALLTAEPMSMKASWCGTLLAEGGDMRIKFVTPGKVQPRLSIGMEKDTTIGWLVDRQQHEGSAESAEQADLSRPSQLTMIFTNTSNYRTSGSYIMAGDTPAEDHGEVVGPATKVFALPELLEMVLQHLHLQHPLQLFTLRRVDSTFHAVIKDS